MFVYTAPSGVEVRSEVEPTFLNDDWFRWGHLSFAFESYLMWGKKVRDALKRKPEAREEVKK